MNNCKNKILLATLSFFILTMLTAYPWHIIFFHDVYQSMGAMTRESPIMPLGMLAVIIQGWVIAYIYSYYYQLKTGHPVITSIKFSLLIGLTVYTVMVFATAAKFQIEPVEKFIAYGTAFQVIQFLVTGVALGLIFGKPHIDK